MRQEKTLLLRLLLAPVLLILLLSTRCSMIGLGVGAAVDASRPDQKEIPLQLVEKLEPGTVVRLIMKNGNEFTGNYAYTEHINDESYPSVYENLRKKVSALLPKYKDQVTIIMATGTRQKGQFLGFDRQHIILKKPETKLQEVSIDLSQINKILNSDGSHINSVTLSEFMATNEFPYLPQNIVISNTTGQHEIALQSVRKVYVHLKKRGKLMGFIIGGLLDILFLRVLRAISQMPGNISIGSGSMD